MSSRAVCDEGVCVGGDECAVPFEKASVESNWILFLEVAFAWFAPDADGEGAMLYLRRSSSKRCFATACDGSSVRMCA